MKTITFEIAGLILAVKGDADFFHNAMWDFECTQEGEPDVSIAFMEKRWSGAYPGKTLLRDKLLSVYETADAYIVRYNDPMWVECYVNEKISCQSYVYLTERGRGREEGNPLDREEVMYSIRDAFFFHMQKRGRMAVHSASFIYRDRVWLFSAKSGTGKSTHVSMWHENGYSIQDFNGDLAICYLENGIAMASSAPWCGTSNLYCNRTVPLGGVVFLERAGRNAVRTIPSAEGIMRLAARCLTPNWDRKLMGQNVDIAASMIPHIFCCVLECNAEPGAAVVCKEYLDHLSES